MSERERERKRKTTTKKKPLVSKCTPCYFVINFDKNLCRIKLDCLNELFLFAR